MVFKAHGARDDDIDRMDLVSSFENPVTWEDTIKGAHSAAEGDDELRTLLESVYLQRDRAEAFETFFASGIPDAIIDVLSRLGISRESRICDVGCGPGQLG